MPPKRTLVHFTAYSDAVNRPSTEDVVQGIFGKSWLRALLWSYREKWLGQGYFSDVQTCFSTHVQHADVERPWQKWRHELVEFKKKLANRQHIVFTGQAPLALWALLGHLVWTPQLSVQIVHFSKGAVPAQCFDFRDISSVAPATRTRMLEVRPPVNSIKVPGKTAAALLWVNWDRKKALSLQKQKQVTEVVAKCLQVTYPISLFSAEPFQAVPLFSDDLPIVWHELEDLLLAPLRNSDYSRLALICTGPDALAALLGARLNPNMWQQIVFLEFVRGEYQIATWSKSEEMS